MSPYVTPSPTDLGTLTSNSKPSLSTTLPPSSSPLIYPVPSGTINPGDLFGPPRLKNGGLPLTNKSIPEKTTPIQEIQVGPGYLYNLFAVVQHEGELSSGHYISWSKARGHWFRFDDDKISLGTEAGALAPNA